MRSVRLGTVLPKDEAHATDVEYGKEQLMLTVVTSILTWLRQLDDFDLLTPSVHQRLLLKVDVRKDFVAADTYSQLFY